MNDEETLKKMMGILDAHNMKIEIWSCNCCDSPSIKFECEGEVITDTSGITCNMFDCECSAITCKNVVTGHKTGHDYSDELCDKCLKEEEK